MGLDSTLRYLKGHHRMTQEYIAEKIGVHFTTYGRYERGEIMPPLHVIKKIGDLFGLTVDQLNDFRIPSMTEKESTPSTLPGIPSLDILVHLDASAESLQQSIEMLQRIHQALIF